MSDIELKPCLKDLIGECWDIAYKAGQISATTDTENGDAQEAWSRIENEIGRLLRESSKVERIRAKLLSESEVHMGLRGICRKERDAHGGYSHDQIRQALQHQIHFIDSLDD